MTEAYIALGSNLDNPVNQIRQAIESIEEHPEIRIKAISGFYENPPMGPQDQPDFVNVVIKISTTLSAEELLDFNQSIEHQQNRQKKIRWGARTIDLDILLYGSHEINLPNLTVPHVGLSQRAFFAGPLFEIAPELILPNKMPLKKLIENIDCSILTKLNDKVRSEENEQQPA